MSSFDPVKYKQTTEQQWQDAAEAWHRWGPTLGAWLGPATEEMLRMALWWGKGHGDPHGEGSEEIAAQ
jgi:hypothetical protein